MLRRDAYTHHAAERACSLNLAIVRTALPYGPYVNYLGTIAHLHTIADYPLKLAIFYLAMIPFIAVAACYGHLKQPMKALYIFPWFVARFHTDILIRNSPGKYPSHTVHVDDIAGAMWAAAEWMAKTGRKEADVLAGEEIVFKNEKSKAAEVEGMVLPSEKVIVPLFNIVSRLRCRTRNVVCDGAAGGRLEGDPSRAWERNCVLLWHYV